MKSVLRALVMNYSPGSINQFGGAKAKMSRARMLLSDLSEFVGICGPRDKVKILPLDLIKTKRNMDLNWGEILIKKIVLWLRL